MMKENSVFLVLMFSLIVCPWKCAVNGSKLRSWVGPDTYFEGNLPSPRQGHEMVSTDDGLLYIFGGWGNSGKK